MSGDRMRTIVAVEAAAPGRLAVRWSNGREAELDLSGLAEEPGFEALRDPQAFAAVEVGDWGHSVRWTSGVELGAQTLWLETLSATGHEDARAFLEWRLRNGLSLTGAAEALGLSRRMAAYYSNGDKPVPRTVALACRGWEMQRAA